MDAREKENLEKIITGAGGVDNNLGLEGRRAYFGTIQKFLKSQGFDPGPIDGYYGPRTQDAVEDYFEDEDDLFQRPEESPWPNYAGIESFYGKPGDTSNLVTIEAPYPLRLAWDTSTEVTRIRCHKKVSESLERILKKVLDHYGLEEIQRLGLDLYGGCFNNRKMRGGSKPSTHSWGVALDFDPGRNRLRWSRERAQLAQPEYEAFWSFWEEEGWTSLGRKKNYDWMHVQAVNA